MSSKTSARGAVREIADTLMRRYTLDRKAGELAAIAMHAATSLYRLAETMDEPERPVGTKEALDQLRKAHAAADNLIRGDDVLTDGQFMRLLCEVDHRIQGAIAHLREKEGA